MLAAGVTTAACAFCAGAGAATSRPTSRPAKPAGPVDAGPVGQFGKDGAYDALARSHKLLIYRNGTKLYASSARCTHRDCVLKRAVNGIEQLKCPCHGSTFDIEGIPVDGDARESLPRHAIRIEKGRVIVDPAKVFSERQWGDPAASVKL
jgi:cytochrome b6-f complex iron-sulfur subunit